MAEAAATTEEKPVLTFNDNQYIIEDLSEKAKYYVAQIQDLDVQLNTTRAKLDQLEVSKRGFVGLLQSEVESPPSEAVFDGSLAEETQSSESVEI